jgi:hypothetical protein
MAGTVKLCVPELAPAGELAGGGGAVGAEVFFACEEAMPDGSAAAECVLVDVGDDAGAPDAGADPDGAAEAVGEPPVAAVGLDPLAHAVRPTPPMTAAMITAGTRHILMLLPSAE